MLTKRSRSRMTAGSQARPYIISCQQRAKWSNVQYILKIIGLEHLDSPRFDLKIQVDVFIKRNTYAW